MMKKLICGILLGFCGFIIYAQNLIPNSGFEDYLSCPTGMEQIDKAIPWKNLTLSTDYYNACNTSSFVSVPINVNGFQHPRSGNGYGGFTTFVLDGLPNFDSRDYMGTPLTSSLEQDSIYLIEFYLNKGNEAIVACDCIDVWLLDSSDLVLPDPLFIGFIENATPQLNSPKGYYLEDTLNWMRLGWTYKATGNENMIIIGNFKTDEETDFVIVEGEALYSAYYYIDDVTVKKIPEYYAQLHIGKDTIVCDSSITKTLTAQPIYDSYLWNTGDTTPSITITTAGTYWVDVGFDDCIITDTIYVESRATEIFSFSDYLEMCPDELPLVLEAPDSMDLYLWSNGSDSSKVEITASGTYWVAAEYACGIWRDTFEVQVIAPPPINLGPDTILCNQPVFQEVLSAPNGYDTYLWSTGDTTASIAINTPDSYWVIADFLCGQVSDTIQMVNQQLLELDLGNDTTFCVGESVWLDVDADFETYTWNTGEEDENIEVTEYGIYFLEATYACGVERDTIEVFSPPDNWVKLPEDTFIGLGKTLTLIPEVPMGNFTYHWQPANSVSCNDCFSPTVSPTENTTYTVIITDEYGCTATDEILVSVEERRGVYIPNAFSPNGDSNNDIFTIYGGEEVAGIEALQIFSRWGELVFQNRNFPPNDVTQGWDGFLKGKKMRPNVFAVVVTVLFKDGKRERYEMDLTLVD